MFYRLKPKIIHVNNVPFWINDEWEPLKLSYCPKYKDKHGGCEFWNEGKGSQECCGCVLASWSVKDGQ